MSPNKREREYARRRYERYQQRASVQREKHRRQRRTAGAILTVLVLVLGVSLAVGLNRQNEPAAQSSPTPDVSAVTYTLPDPSFAQARTWTGTITTNVGAINVELDGATSPQAVASFVSLAQQGFFDGTTCHRLALGIHVLQCGDPTGTGSGGPGYTFGPVENAPADNVYPVGTVAMARPQDDGASMGSQFFLVYADSTIPADAAGGYTRFGRITSGLDVLTAVADAGVQGGEPDGPPNTGVTIQGVETQ